MNGISFNNTTFKRYAQEEMLGKTPSYLRFTKNEVDFVEI